MNPMKRDIQLVVEDELSGIVLRKLVEEFGNGLSVHNVFLMKGFGKIKTGIPRFKNASRAVPHIVLTDLDRALCAPSLMRDWDVDEGAKDFLFRIAVREVEAWLLADREGFSEYLNIPLVKIPQHPEQENDPKQTLFNLVRKCKKRRLVEELVPAVGSCASIGPLYNMRMGAYVRDNWNVQRALMHSDSLDRAVKRISAF